MSGLSLINKVMAKLGYHRIRRSYQDSRFPEDQYDLISKTTEYKNAKNSLEIGCNKGKLVEMFSNDGKFAVGVDLASYWGHNEDSSAILGAHPVMLDDLENLPSFDVICVLSVHHQWVTHEGDDYAKKMIKGFADKSKLALFVEFASIAGKYAYKQSEHFVDNDDDSVCHYSENWLRQAVPDRKIQYLGKTRESAKTEPYRHLFEIS